MARPWIRLTAEHLKSAMTAKEVADFGRAVTDGSPDDRVVEILSGLTQEIRGYIKTCRQNTSLSADPTKIPEEFKTRALDVARWRLLITIPGYQPGEARRVAYEQAERFFRDVAACKFRPEEAEDAVPVTVPDETPIQTPRIRGRRRLFTRESQDGI